MIKRFGQFNPDGGPGLLRPVYFPSLASMDTWTSDDRRLDSRGGGVYGNTLPRSIKAQFSAEPGHSGSVPVGSLQEITFHDDGNVSGRGWLADIEEAHKLVVLVETKTMFHNSIDMANVQVEINWKSDDPNDPDFWEATFDFVQWDVAATTFVDIPAFANAHGTLDAPSELMAAAVPTMEPLVIEFTGTTFEVELECNEVIASLATETSFDDFHKPEPDHPTKHTVTPDGQVFGHVADWTIPHASMTGKRYAPRPTNYDSFHEGSVETDRGTVRTGPIFFLGGHPDSKLGHPSNASKAYGGVENGWADVRVTNGRFGPWYCGRARPGMSEQAIYVARASGISGHWIEDDLAAIVSVNVRGYKIPGSELSADHDGVRVEDGKVVELVASLHTGPTEAVDPHADRAKLGEEIVAKLQGSVQSMTFAPNGYTSGVPVLTTTLAVCADPQPVDPPLPETPDYSLLAAELEIEIELNG